MAQVYLPSSRKLNLIADVPMIVPTVSSPVTVQIPTGSTIHVGVTCAPTEEVMAGTAEWEGWPAGNKVGPFIDTLVAQVTALRITAIGANGVVYLVGAE